MTEPEPEPEDKPEPEPEPEDEPSEEEDEPGDELEALLRKLVDEKDSGDEEEEEDEPDEEEEIPKTSDDVVKITLKELLLEKFPAKTREHVAGILKGEEIDVQLKLLAKLKNLDVLIGKEAAGKIPVGEPKRASIFDNPNGHLKSEKKKAYWM